MTFSQALALLYLLHNPLRLRRVHDAHQHQVHVDPAMFQPRAAPWPRVTNQFSIKISSDAKINPIPISWRFIAEQSRQ